MLDLVSACMPEYVGCLLEVQTWLETCLILCLSSDMRIGYIHYIILTCLKYT